MPKGGWASKQQQRTVDTVQNNLRQAIKVGRMAPVPLGNLAATSDLKTRGAQVGCHITSLEGVDSFVLMRNFSRDPGSAQVIHVWTAKSLATTPQTYPIALQHTDADPAIAGKKVYYWVKAIPLSTRTTDNVFISGPQAFDASNLPSAKQIAGDFASYQAYTPTTQPLTAITGGPVNSATINIASFQIQYPFDTDADGDADLISYNSGAITPLLDATQYFVYYDDPSYKGGAETYIATTDQTLVCAGLHRQYLGQIMTPAHGGGGTGGGGGGGGSCFSGETEVITKRGPVPISQVTTEDHVYSRVGWRKVFKVLVHDFKGVLHDMGGTGLVTATHRIYSTPLHAWVQAKDMFEKTQEFEGKVYNLELKGGASDNAHCYLLKNSFYAHNTRKI